MRKVKQKRGPKPKHPRGFAPDPKERRHYTESYICNPVHRLSISLIGVGGSGSQMLSHLARVNEGLKALGHPGVFVRAFDPDIVTEANIGRQLFSKADLGLNKAKTAVTRINRFFGLDWEAIEERFENISPANITISCVDSYEARQQIYVRLLETKGKKSRQFNNKDYDYQPWEIQYYWMDLGNSKTTGQVIIGTVEDIRQPKQSKYDLISSLPTFLEQFPLSTVNREEEDGPSCSLAQALGRQDLFINSTLSNLGCNLLWKMITTMQLPYRGVFLNLDTMQSNPLTI
jgi:PRTRC genetic system ThiF family protein